MKVLFLYSELAGYFVACLDALAKRGAEVHLVHWPVNKEAPFNFSFSNIIKHYERQGFDEKQLIALADKISPDAIYCSGWVDKEYLKVCKRFRNRIPVIVGFDNRWTGSVRQRIAVVLADLFIHKIFSCCWIPGKPQLEFAHRLRFSESRILSGFYSCDHDFFYRLYLQFSEVKKKKFPHRFIFTGRYYDFKGIKDLWQAFVELKNDYPNDWELWCLGTGDIDPIVHRDIKHFGFIQPGNLERFILETGVFVLPSHVEPWGVAVHEFASAGFPLICSDKVGSVDMFLKNNGFVFRAGNIVELKNTLKRMIEMPDEKLVEMGDWSAEISKQNTPDKWCDTLMSVL